MDEQRPESAWRELVMTEEGASTSARSTQVPGVPEDPEHVRDRLLEITSSAFSLARFLDGLASQYHRVGTARPSDVHVALDQAAAAAEDLATCTKAAVLALEDEE